MSGLGMSLGLNLSYRLEQRCKLCSGTMSAHKESCVIGRMEKLAESRHVWACPACHRRTVELNTDDWYECRGCHSQFTTGLIVPEAEPPHEKFYLMDDMDAIPVYSLPKKGRGLFRLDRDLKRLEKEKKRLLKVEELDRQLDKKLLGLEKDIRILARRKKLILKAKELAKKLRLEAKKKDKSKKSEEAARTNEIVQMRTMGYTLQKIGEKLNLSRERIRQILEPLKIKIINPKQHSNMPRELIDLWNWGMNFKEIANLYGVSYPTIYNRIRRMRKEGEFLLLQKTDRKTKKYEEIAALWMGGISIAEITEKYGVTRSTIVNRVSKMRKEGWLLPLRNGRRKEKPLAKDGACLG